MSEWLTYPKVTARVSGSAVQKLSKGGHGTGYDEAGVTRLGEGKASGRLL